MATSDPRVAPAVVPSTGTPPGVTPINTQQPVVIQSPQQPVIVPLGAAAAQANGMPGTVQAGVAPLRIYSHSNLFYWWPVWVVGYILAFITYSEGTAYELGPNNHIIFHQSSNLGVFFFLTLFSVFLITNVTARGLISAMVVLSAILITVVLAYYDLWDPVLTWFANLKIYLNLGAYFWFSTLMFVTWFCTVFIFDRMSYFEIKQGQITHAIVLGGASRSYDTENMVLEKHRDDLFRHWVLGLGSGDLRIHTFGAQREQIEVHNVLFIGSKVDRIQALISERPSEFGHVTIK